MFTQIREFVASHPAFAAMFGYVFVSLMSLLFHARSSEEYASKPPRVAALFKLSASVGCDAQKVWDSFVSLITSDSAKARASALASIVAGFTVDVPKAIEALYQLVTGTRREDKTQPPMPPAIIAGGAAMLAIACTPAQRQTVRTVLDVAQVACIVAHQTFDDPTVARVCGIADDAIGPMRVILSESRYQSAQAATSALEHAGATTCETH